LHLWLLLALHMTHVRRLHELWCMLRLLLHLGLLLLLLHAGTIVRR
jgi:hypothetical protein